MTRINGGGCHQPPSGGREGGREGGAAARLRRTPQQRSLQECTSPSARFILLVVQTLDSKLAEVVQCPGETYLWRRLYTIYTAGRVVTHPQDKD